MLHIGGHFDLGSLEEILQEQVLFCCPDDVATVVTQSSPE